MKKLATLTLITQRAREEKTKEYGQQGAIKTFVGIGKSIAFDTYTRQEAANIVIRTSMGEVFNGTFDMLVEKLKKS